ncbi:MAG: hypothetical protein HY913_07505 [Desulfomonile tiedjei]|nr:hypothetical protein [Desulfomonile tiedjei]
MVVNPGETREEQAVSLRDTLSMFYRRIRLFKAIVIVLPLGTLVACLVMDPVYESTAKVLVTAKRETSSLLQYPKEQGAQMSFNLNVDETDLNSEMELLKSPDLWMRTVNKLGVAAFKHEDSGIVGGELRKLKKTVRELLGLTKSQIGDSQGESPEVQKIAEGLIKKFKATPAIKSKIIDLSFRYSDPVMGQKILATLLDLYIPYHLEVYSLPGAEQFFAGQADLYKQKYENADRELVEFKQKWGLSLTERQMAELITAIKQIDDALVEVNASLSQYEVMLASAKKGVLPSGQITGGGQRSGESTFINVLSTQLLRAAQKEWQTAEIYQPGTRDYQVTADMVRSLTKRFREALQGEMDIVAAKKKSLEESLKEKAQQLELLQQKSDEARRMQLEVTVAKERYVQYMAKEEEARLENMKGGTQLRDVAVVGKPLTPAVPVFPKTLLFVLGAFFLAIPVGIAVILTAHFLDHTFDNPRTLAAHTGYPVLASIGKA